MSRTIKERLSAYLQYKGINKSEFGRIIGVSSSYISSMRKSIQPDKAEKIASSFPDLNIAWLMTGEGEMLRAGAVRHATATGDGSVAVSGNNNSHIGPGQGGGEEEVLRERVKSLEALLEEKERLIGILMDGRKG